ncbi:hypothetical protein, partial [Klebsiella pneumoniae]|uniref:hypothetical protein n=1 Tax=Klebsiella pneumoniae TaxID=573 RepID=UPI003EDEE7CE
GRVLIEDPSQQRAYFAQNSPPQVAIIDTSLGTPDSHGLPANKIVEAIDICTEPSNMTLRQFAAPPGSANPVASRL